MTPVRSTASLRKLHTSSTPRKDRLKEVNALIRDHLVVLREEHQVDVYPHSPCTIPGHKQWIDTFVGSTQQIIGPGDNRFDELGVMIKLCRWSQPGGNHIVSCYKSLSGRIPVAVLSSDEALLKLLRRRGAIRRRIPPTMVDIVTPPSSPSPLRSLRSIPKTPETPSPPVMSSKASKPLESPDSPLPRSTPPPPVSSDSGTEAVALAAEARPWSCTVTLAFYFMGTQIDSERINIDLSCNVFTLADYSAPLANIGVHPGLVCFLNMTSKWELHAWKEELFGFDGDVLLFLCFGKKGSTI